MNDDTSIGSRLRRLMEEQEFGENELARRTGVPQPTIHRILKGASQSPRISNLEKLANALGTTVSYLAHGDAPPRRTGMNEASNRGLAASVPGPLGIPLLPNAAAAAATSVAYRAARAKPTPPTYHYPVLSWAQAAVIRQPYSAAESVDLRVEPSGFQTKGTGFWLEVRGDAMAAPTGMVPSLPEGTMILFDSDAPVIPGKLVLATLPDSQDPTFRKLIEESGQRYLKPLNPSYPLILLDKSSSVLAVALEARTRL
ncbi:XRE family transcriptional regulator [Halomonas sp. HP20-15]|uniref:helix-turn-helix domain-containing protein n=1 Tax=Halomonas sp. HP20-15 TaxID=3085901 RepID=UPI002981DDE5|nr:XRE family transcriptional regulator [Halomonas sp. HP20-15]MDW5376393.1 XRE family transcriptional regulator [Halomonas sp. HP20-15]